MSTNKKNKSQKPVTKRSWIEYGLQIVRELLNTGDDQPDIENASLNSISMEEAQKGKIRLELRQRKLLQEITRLEAEKRRYFEQGSKSSSVREQKVLAGQIQQLEQDSKMYDSELFSISVQLRLVKHFIRIKEQQRIKNEMGLVNIFTDRSIEDIMMELEGDITDIKYELEEMKNAAKSLDSISHMDDDFAEDEDQMSIVGLMQEAHERADSIDAIFTKMSQERESRKIDQEDLSKDDVLDDAWEDL